MNRLVVKMIAGPMMETELVTSRTPCRALLDARNFTMPSALQFKSRFRITPQRASYDENRLEDRGRFAVATRRSEGTGRLQPSHLTALLATPKFSELESVTVQLAVARE